MKSIGNTQTYVRIDRDGSPSEVGKYMLFGSYPAGRITDEALVSVLNGMAGELPEAESCREWTSYKYYIFDDNTRDFMWYRDLQHEGALYRGVYFTDYRPNETMNTSEENRQGQNGYHPGRVYWFRYEPLRWQVLEERDGKALLITELCIDSQPYRDVVWDNSYVRSSIRRRLNSDFADTAFSRREREAVIRETVVNDMEDEDVCDGDIPGSDTRDLVHLLSVDEAARMIPREELRVGATDYAMCQGIGVHSENGCSDWWLRTPYYTVDSWAQTVCSHYLIDFGTGDIGSTETGIRPALWLRL